MRERGKRVGQAYVKVTEEWDESGERMRNELYDLIYGWTDCQPSEAKDLAAVIIEAGWHK